MAQIIKHQDGGSTSRKYGTFTIDGNAYEVNDEFLNQMASYGKSLDGDTAYQFGKITDALRAGKNLSYNSSSDSLSGDVQFDTTRAQGNRLKNRRSRFGRWLGNTWRGKEEAARNAIHSLRNFTYVKPTPGGTNYDWSGKINVEYKRDKDGKFEVVNGRKVFINGANNVAALKRLGSIEEILKYTDNDRFKGYNNLNKQAYIDFYNKLGPTGIQALKERIENGTWTEEDKLALDDIGIFLGDEPSQEDIERAKLEADPTTAAEQVARDKYAKAGIDYNLKNLFGIDDNGSVVITDPTLRSYIGSDNAWLNDEFRDAHKEYASYIPEKTGFFVIDGKVYRGDDLESLSKIRAYLDFVEENKRTAGNASNIRQYWSEARSTSPWNSTSVDPEGNPVWSPYFAPGKFAADVSGEYVRQTGDPLIYDYFPNYDVNDSSQFDAYGHPLRSLAERVYIDPVTKQRVEFNKTLQPQLNEDAIGSYYDNIHSTAFNPYYTIGNQGGYKQIANVGDVRNPNSMAALYYNPELDRYYYFDENPGNNNLTLNSKLESNWDKMRDYYWNIDPRLGSYIKEHPDILRDQNVKALIGETIQNPYLALISSRRQTDFSKIMSSYPELYKLLQDLYKSQTLQYGNGVRQFSGSGGNTDLRRITTPEELERMGLAYRVPKNKKGGILKHQIGGVASNRKNSFKASGESIQQSKSKLRSAGEEKVIGDGTALNASDKAELAALIADAASLGATFVPVYGNVAGAGIGAVGSLTGFGADVARDGLDWGDIGNLVLNLGLDAATLLPWVGTGAKATKIAKALKKSGAVAKAVGAAVSGGSALEGLKVAWDNIQDGKWTISDIRTVLNGIRGVANISRIKGNAKTKGSNSNTVTLKPKIKGLPEIKLNRSELESIKKTPQNSRTDKLEELIISHLPKKAKTDNIENILEAYGVKTSGKINWNWKTPLKVERNNTIDVDQFKYDKTPGVYRNPNELGWWNWNRRASIRDAKTNRNNPYFKDFAKVQTNEIPSTPLEVIRRPEIDGGITRSQIFEPGVRITSFSRRPITRPIYSNLAPDLGFFSDNPDVRVYFDIAERPTFYKKGGKVVKADKGTNSNWFLGKDGKPLNVSGDTVTITAKSLGGRPKIDFGGVTLSTKIDPNIRKGAAKLAEAGNTKAKMDLFGQLEQEGTIGQSMYGHGESKGDFNLNPDMLLGIGDFLASKMGINRTAQKMKDAVRKGMIGSQQQMLPEFYSRFSDNGLHKMYDDRIKTMRQYKTVTNDPNQATAERLIRDANIDQMENERDTKFSQMIDQYNDKLLAQKQQYANLRTQIANENRNRWNQGLAQLDMIDANKVGQQTQNIKNLIYQFRQDNARDLLEKQQAEMMSKRLKAQNDFESELRSRFGNLYTPDKEKTYGSFENFILREHNKEYSNLYNKYFANLYIDAYNEGPAHSWWGRKKIAPYEAPYQYTPQEGTWNTVIRKQGGTMPRFRNTSEQAFLDQQKAINKAVNDLNNNIIKLFIKMMS